MLEFHQLSRNTSHECLMKVPRMANLKQTQLTSQKTWKKVHETRVAGSTDHQRVFFSNGGFAEGPGNKPRRHKQWRCGDLKGRIPSGLNTGNPETNWSLVCDSINLCELFVTNKLDQTLKKLKISTLKSMCNFFGVDISGPAPRKAPFMNAIYGLLSSCQCQISA